MASRIERAISLGISADTSQARKDLRAMASVIRAVKDPTDQLKATLQLLKLELDDGKLSQNQYGNAVAKAEVKADKQRAAIARLKNEFRELKSAQDKAQGLKTKASIDAERQSVEQHRAALQKRLTVFKQEKREREALALAAKKQAEQNRREIIESQKRRREGFNLRYETPIDSMRRQMHEANRLYSLGIISADEYKRGVSQINREHSLLRQGFSQLKGAVVSILGPLTAITVATELLRKSIVMSAELKSAEARFEALTKSVSESKRILEDLRALSSQGIRFEAGQRSVATMLQFGVESRNVIQNLREMADVTGGDVQRLESLSLAFAQSQAAGRLMGQELLQMVNAGFNPLQQISKETGVSLVELKKRMEEGGISSEMVAGALRRSTEEGGMYHGMLEKINETTKGSLNRSMAEFEKTLISIGDAIEPITKISLDTAAKEMEKFRDSVNLVKDATTSVGDSVLYMTKMYEDHLEIARGAMAMNNVRSADLLRMFPAFLRPDDSFINSLNSDMTIAISLGEDVKRTFSSISDTAMSSAARLKDAFGPTDKSLFGQYIDAVYGDESELVKLLRNQSVDDERQRINALIEQKADLESIMSQSSSEAVDRLDSVMQMRERIAQQEKLNELEKNRIEQAKRAQEEITRATQKAREDLKKFARDLNGGDFIRNMARLQLANQQGLIDQDVFMRERNRLLNSQIANENGAAAPRADRGSQEAFRLITGQQTSWQNALLKEQQKQRILAEKSLPLEKERNRLLKEMDHEVVG